MILFANGCSWTYGGGLDLDAPDQNDQRLQNVWPHHLGNLLGVEKTINLATGAGSNQRIIRTTYDWILSQPKESLSDTLAIIQVAELSRYELHVPRFDGDKEGWIKFKAGIVAPETFRTDINNFYIDFNNKRLSLYSDLEGMYSLLVFCESLTGLFNKFGIKYYFWSNGILNYEEFSDSKILGYIKESFNWLDTDFWNYDRVSPEDLHPSFNGHRQIAQLIIDNMR